MNLKKKDILKIAQMKTVFTDQRPLKSRQIPRIPLQNAQIKVKIGIWIFNL